MIKILFICLGNICRSPMAEFVLKDMAARRGLASKFYIASAATSAEELGNPVHRGTREKLRACDICLKHERGTVGLTYRCTGALDMDVALNLPGKFSVYNSLCAIAVTRHFQVPQETLKKSHRSREMQTICT